MEYHTINYALMVKPITEPIFSERATTIRLDDEAGECYVSVEQSGSEKSGIGKVLIDPSEWPHIRDAIDDMLRVGADVDKQVIG